MGQQISRRDLLKDSAVAAAGAAVVSAGIASPARGDTPGSTIGEPATYVSDWSRCHDRVWLGRDLWANPLQDWRIAGGRAECVNAAPDRSVHLLTRQLGDKGGDFSMSVRVGRVGGGAIGAGKGSFGFRIVQGPLKEYRNSLLYGQGLNCGVAADGGIFIGDLGSAKPGTVKLDSESVELRLTTKNADGKYTLTLAVLDAAGKPLGEVTREDVPAEQLVGNVAIVANFAGPPRGAGGGGRAGAGRAGAANRPATRPNQQQQAAFGAGAFWFAEWRVMGSKLARHDDRAFGPILFNQYTLHNGTLKMTVQMPPIGAKENQSVRLQTKQAGGDWKTIGESDIDADSRLASFRIDKWDASVDVPYRLLYGISWTDGTTSEHGWPGTIRRDPVDQPVITVADISCNGHQAFPNADYVAQCAKLNPDLMAFVGDQFYESSGGYGVQRNPIEPAILDYLRKWYLHGWTWRDLTRDRPSVSLPDDHDVYQGNIWGEGGAPRKGTQEAGGYDMNPRWVNVCYRCQTAHHPDPYDPAPAKQGIVQYYGPLTYGRVSFAIVADRMYKSAPEGKVPPTGGRGDHVKDPKFDPKTADLPGLQLLGDKQVQFLREWAADWKHADMKAVISQTIFTAMATTHGGNRERLRVDYDTNAWPQRARNDALREIRKCFAFHLAGDQHLPAVVHYGIEGHRDAGVAFAGPAVNTTYPRWWEPAEPGKNRKEGAAELTGDFVDHLGNPMTVMAYVNGKAEPRKGVLEALIDKSSGLGIVRLDKSKRTITVECWPLGADVSKPGTQFPGWPLTVSVMDNYARKAVGKLPAVDAGGAAGQVVQVVAETDGQVLYTLRVPLGQKFEPPVFAAGKYTVRVGDPERNEWRETKGVEVVVS